MKGGRKNLKRAAEEEILALQQGQSIMQVVSLRGSNLIEVMDARGKKSLALFPAKFQKSMWTKRGNFVVVDESGRDEALESGQKSSDLEFWTIRMGICRDIRLLRKKMNLTLAMMMGSPQ